MEVMAKTNVMAFSGMLVVTFLQSRSQLDGNRFVEEGQGRNAALERKVGQGGGRQARPNW